jgi:hypothetical protein
MSKRKADATLEIRRYEARSWWHVEKERKQRLYSVLVCDFDHCEDHNFIGR